MPDNQKTKHYRIGTYAQNMGVTPDLLKHYEKMGLLHAQASENGYRYYPFSESVPLLECFALRNYEMPLQQMHDLLYEGTLEDLHEALGERAQALERRMLRDQTVLREYQAFDRWMKSMEGRTMYMLMEERQDVYFLPHSKGRDFLEDSRIRDLLPRWIEWMPAVKSCRKIVYRENEDCLADSYWGLSVPVSAAEKCGIPVNDVVERLPGGRQMICHYRVNIALPKRNTVWFRVKEELKKASLKPSGPVRQIVLASLFSPDSRTACGWFAIPLDR